MLNRLISNKFNTYKYSSVNLGLIFPSSNLVEVSTLILVINRKKKIFLLLGHET